MFLFWLEEEGEEEGRGGRGRGRRKLISGKLKFFLSFFFFERFQFRLFNEILAISRRIDSKILSKLENEIAVQRRDRSETKAKRMRIQDGRRRFWRHFLKSFFVRNKIEIFEFPIRNLIFA
ncbi:hypothetical protein BG74_03350 [Sodalis-like endosymbiont of Proechinophthirus fluctus]|nr:hypothetical protein BG74_03350 [Sodalis-like endosymbiont of Proechinophthirus fluctus]